MRIELIQQTAKAGGGSLPLLELPSRGLAITIEGISVNRVESFLRNFSPPIIARIKEDRYILDPRTVQDGEMTIIETAFRQLLHKDEK